MFQFLSSIPPGLTGFFLAAALLAGLFVMLAKGQIIPRVFHEDRMRDKDTQIEILRQTDRENRETIRQSKENDETIIQMLEGLQQRYDGGDPS